MALSDSENARLDDAARAGWLYFIAGHTQDEIAKKLKVSRATAQRLVSLCLSERLITFRLEHPIAACMELSASLTRAFELSFCEVTPTDPDIPLSIAGIAERGARLIESRQLEQRLSVNDVAAHVARLLRQVFLANDDGLLGVARLAILVRKRSEIPTRVLVKLLSEFVDSGRTGH